MKVGLLYLNNDKMVSRGVGYLAMSIRDAGHSLRFYDTAWTDQDDAVQRAIERHYDVLLVSSTSFYYRRVKAIARAIKQQSRMSVVVGGAHATILQERMLEEVPEIDYICVGEGEEFIVEFLDYLGSGGDPAMIRNLGYRDANGRIKINPVRPCTDLSTLAPFDYSLFHPESVVTKTALLSGFCYVFATRGCPFNCSYCCNSYYLNLYKHSFLRTQRVDTVLEELHSLRKNYPIQLAYFGDEMILFNRRYVTELFTRIHTELEMPYGCMFRAGALTPRIVDLMRNTGCRYVAVGIECGDEQFRRQYLNRRTTNRQIIRAFRMLRTIPDIWITTYNMRGFPVSFDQRLTQATKQFNQLIAPNHAQTTWFYPIPGTRMYDYCAERDLIDWDKMNQAEDYFRQSVLKHPVSPGLDTPLYR